MILTAALAWAMAAQEPTITYESTAITIRAFCTELGRQTGRQFRAWDEVRSELLALRLTNAPLDTVLQKIAYAARAKVTVDGTSYDLRPDPVAIAQNQTELRSARTKVAQDALDKADAKLRTSHLTPEEADKITLAHVRFQNRTTAGAPEDAEESARFESQSPERQALLKLFCAIPADQLAAIHNRDTDVWSTSPTRMEHAWPEDVTPIVLDLGHDGAIWNEALDRAAAVSTSPNRRYPVNRDVGRTARLRLSVTNENELYGRGFVLTLATFDVQGVAVSYDSDLFPHRITEVSEPAGEPLPAVQLTGPDALLLDIRAGWMRKWKAEHPNPQAIHAALNSFYEPEKFEPSAMPYGRALLELAKARGEQLVADQDPKMLNAVDGDFYRFRKLNLQLLFQWLKHSAPNSDAADVAVPAAEVKYGDGWLLVRPHLLDESAEYEFDRPALGKYVRGARDSRTVTLSDEMALAAAAGSEYGFWRSWIAQALEQLVPDCYPGGPIFSRDSTVRFLGLLDDSQLVQAQRQGLPLSACSKAALDELWRRFRTQRFDLNRSIPDWVSSSRTRALPNGLPGGGVLRVSSTHEYMYGVHKGDPSAWNYNTSPAAALWLVMDSGLANGDLKILSKSGGEIRPIDANVYTLRFDFPNGVYCTDGIMDYTWAGPYVKSVDALPEAFRADIALAIEQYHRDTGR